MNINNNEIKFIYSQEKEKREQKGITLVALVVTIIILVILAGVSINLVIGNSGIIAKAQIAKKNAENAAWLEKAQMIVTRSKNEQRRNRKINRPRNSKC